MADGLAAVDARGVPLPITAAGRRQLRRLEKQLVRIQDQLLAPLSPEERQEFARLLTRLLRHHARGVQG